MSAAARLERARRWATGAAVGVGCAVIAVAGGGIGALALGTAAAVGLGRWAQPTRGATGWRAANLLALLAAVGAGLAGLPMLSVGAGLVCWLQVHRAFTGRSAEDDRVALLLALLQVLLGCILTVSPLLAPLFVGFALLSPVALLLCHLGVEAPAWAGGGPPLAARHRYSLVGLGLGCLALSSLFFLAIPRIQGGVTAGFDAGQSVAGFGGEVSIGDLGAIQDNPAVVLRVKLGGAPLDGPLYLRGAAFDHFDGRRWARTVGGDRAVSVVPPAEEEPGLQRQEILAEPLTERVIFGLPEIRAVSVQVDPLEGAAPRISRDSAGAVRLAGAPRRLAYTVWSRPPDRARMARATPDPRASARGPAELVAARLGVWTQLPDGLDPRIPALAASVAQGAGPGALAKAQALEDYLRTQFTWTDVPEPEAAGQSLSTFLFSTRRGHCEYFATALAVLLRSQGLPARVVNGFLGGEWNEVGGYFVLRQRDAHAWVELNLGEAGWLTLDGTPAGEARRADASLVSSVADWASAEWLRLVLDYDLSAQIAAAESFAIRLPSGGGGVGAGGGAASGAVVLLVGALALWVGARGALALLGGERRARRGPKERVASSFAAGRRLALRRGWEIPEALPPLDAARWLALRAGDTAEPLERLAWLLYRVRYGGEPDGSLAPASREALRELRLLPRRRAG